MYISLGVSGQIQHVVGIRDSKIIVAVNSNANAPIFMAADYGIVGDMYEIIPLLTEAIRDVKV
jgi:electron transfer flavoprotein alpha subunit